MLAGGLSICLAWILGAVCAPWTAAQPQGTDARVYTLAGGGSVPPRDGLPASEADLRAGVAWLSPLPDGSVAFLSGRRRVLLLQPDNRIRILPAIVANGKIAAISALAATPDGSLLAATSGGRLVLRLGPTDTAWHPWFDLARIPRWGEFAVVTQLVGLADGFALDAWDFGAWRVTEDGRIQRIRVPARSDGRALLPLPGGDLGVRLADDPIVPRERIARVGEDGALTTLVRTYGPVQIPSSLVALPDGGFLRGTWFLERIAASGSMDPFAGDRPGLGLGDGGPPQRALISADELAFASDGTLMMSSSVPLAGDRPAMDLEAERRDGRLVTEPSSQSVTVIRAIVGRPTARPLVAVSPLTYRLLATGQIEFVSTFAGRAVVQVRRDRRLAASAEIDAREGINRVLLPVRVPRADLMVTIRVAGDGRAGAARLAATTLRRLRIDRALPLLRRIAAADQGGDSEAYFATAVGRCERELAAKLKCRAIRISGGPGLRERRRCDGIFVARLRPDGVRGHRRYGRRLCRAIGRP